MTSRDKAAAPKTYDMMNGRCMLPQTMATPESQVDAPSRSRTTTGLRMLQAFRVEGMSIASRTGPNLSPNGVFVEVDAVNLKVDPVEGEGLHETEDGLAIESVRRQGRGEKTGRL